MSHNQLSSLTDSLSNLCSLKTADFSDNKLVHVPPSIHKCRKLNSLKLHNNPLKDGRLRKLACDSHSPRALFEYLKKLDTPVKKGKKEKGKTANVSTKTEAMDKEVDELVESVETQVVVEQSIESPHIKILRPGDDEVSSTGNRLVISFVSSLYDP